MRVTPTPSGAPPKPGSGLGGDVLRDLCFPPRPLRLKSFRLLKKEFTLRDYRPADFETLWRIDQECFEEGISYSRAELMHYLRRREAITLVAERDGAVAGFLVVTRERDQVGHIITIDTIASARRSGLGTLLMNEAERRLAAAGCTVVALEVAVNNAAAIGFYKRLGYSVLKTLRRYYKDELDALLLTKRLPTSL